MVIANAKYGSLECKKIRRMSDALNASRRVIFTVSPAPTLLLDYQCLRHFFAANGDWLVIMRPVLYSSLLFFIPEPPRFVGMPM